jgi:hypothetical protein
MARLPQINFEVDPTLEADLNTVIAKSGMKRTEYLRMIAREIVAADADGRPFLSNNEGIDQARFAELLYKIDPLTTELDRSLREVTRLQSKLQRSMTADDRETAQSASGAATKIATAIAAKLGPLRSQLEQLAASTNRPSWLAKFDDKLDQSIALSKRPRLQRTYQMQGWNLNGWGWTAVGFGGWIVSLATFLLLAMILPSSLLAVPAANTLLGSGSGGVCAIAERRFGGICEPFMDATGTGVRVTQRKAKRP